MVQGGSDLVKYLAMTSQVLGMSYATAASVVCVACTFIYLKPAYFSVICYHIITLTYIP